MDEIKLANHVLEIAPAAFLAKRIGRTRGAITNLKSGRADLEKAAYSTVHALAELALGVPSTEGAIKLKRWETKTDYVTHFNYTIDFTEDDIADWFLVAVPPTHVVAHTIAINLSDDAKDLILSVTSRYYAYRSDAEIDALTDVIEAALFELRAFDGSFDPDFISEDGSEHTKIVDGWSIVEDQDEVDCWLEISTGSKTFEIHDTCGDIHVKMVSVVAL